MAVPKSRINEVLQLVTLQDTKNKKVKQFSLGMKQRLSIAVALLHQPELLILDEPTNGLDPNGIIETRELIKKLNKEQGVTILVSSHILAEVEKMASHVGIIHKGKLLFQGTLPELQHLKKTNKVSSNWKPLTTKMLWKCYSLILLERQNGHLVLPFKNNEQTASINKLLIENGIDVYRLQPKQNDLEQVIY